MPITKIIKHSDSTIAYSVVWSDWLNGSDTIASVNWVVPPEIATGTRTSTQTSAIIFVEGLADGGTAGTVYTMTCQIVTVGGETSHAHPIPVIFKS